MDLKGLLLDHAGVLDDPGDAPSGVPPLLEVARCIRRAGIGTALVSNANGLCDPELADQFDVVVLSGAAGVAKPNTEIYLLTARRLGLEPQQCVFVDDLHRNVVGAVAAGMVGIHHQDVGSTVAELAALFDLEFPL
ncbi:HAD-IA family hydrolase [Saccharopolyspora phatthalungensis]|uniref:HAD superfamily hydrolase (TIGR01509 family) n=1 Tax=Saccharopolyspora phatthalungensis TaxID=664693 RepID=A0A840Q9P9_9PSEU|nr:HAD-IA family hydrolase [Saccharopolyspora phatthalungensis]MBB5155175.1 HAD superfamily hydrolase (TIGR01509 family) [Saccharopolyspora phatthalungensis]